ncbi:hydroxyproline O-arabinosyltransferase 3-like isoform X2 [Glycine soja]|uniref:hydroxyproline O-arabinosyltransferase 3-like isoform X2 n=1 Tax=Glycine soja TaxID=3848 RepID=UPI0007191031|nr:hydroxyproline O-arabinosyltransferase 3-like isoform X2 [Glycine soja]|eukprot:XP_014628340.1 hydroxyproline O-arabinosyltransferase 3 isoform X2 [Glycine max]
MIVRKNKPSARSLLMLFVMVLAFLFVTYNLVFIIKHHMGGTWVAEELRFLDPVISMPGKVMALANSNSKFHVAVTATDAAYSQWQCRIMYYWYKKVKDMPGSDMGKFTRIVHSGRQDQLMDEIPTFVVDPLPEGLDRGYVVMNRPWAFVQWLEKADIEEEYILMAEPDHIFVNPLPNLTNGNQPAGYPFFYIKPVKHEKILRKFYPKANGPITAIDPIGNSPVIIQKSLLEEIAPTWVNISLQMKDDPATDETFGWVLEMYAYAVASALHGVRHILHDNFMLQPPWDFDVENNFIIHYTYACDYNLKVLHPKTFPYPLLEFLKVWCSL